MTRLSESRPPSHPGEMLLEEFLRPLSIPQTVFSERIRVSYFHLNSIENGQRSVTPDTELRLERATGRSAGFWLNHQRDWDLWHTLHTSAAKEIRKIQRLDGLAHT